MTHSNERGIIAETYRKLQALDVLKAARDNQILPKASSLSTIRAVFQAAEVGLLNLSDLMSRASRDVESKEWNLALVKICWAHGFHRILSRLSLMPHQLTILHEESVTQSTLRIRDSPAYCQYIAILEHFDRCLLKAVEVGDFEVLSILANESVDNFKFRLLHLARINAHEATGWERNLSAVQLPFLETDYENLVAPQLIHEAVYHTTLTGDTFYTQFRGLHQVPEILGEEINDHIEQAIRVIRSDDLRQAVEHLNCANTLTDAVLLSLIAMADNLATVDYHRIRENLGLTSGSHSICLHYHMFTDLYDQLWEAIVERMLGRPLTECAESDIEERIRQLNSSRFADMQAWLLHVIMSEALKFHIFTLQWRESHLHLARNNLGSEMTKSLTGLPDAITAVSRMRDYARTKASMKLLAETQGILPNGLLESPEPLIGYIASSRSLDAKILAATGEITRERFKQVQERSGVFANSCPFSPPTPRKV